MEEIVSKFKEYVAQGEKFVKEHKIITGGIIGVLLYLMFRKKGSND